MAHPGTFFARLEARCTSIGSLLCVGIDPHEADIGGGGADAALAFGRRIMRATAPYAAAFKPNAAFFEALGPDGVAALHTLISEADGVPVVLDAKRGDIGSTSAAYARAAFDVAGAGAITLQPYLGWEAMAPFLTDRSKGCFVLCRTTNPGAERLQEAELASGSTVFEAIAAEAAAHAASDQIGLVAGGTAPEAMAKIRAVAPRSWLLVPGIGAQGGRADRAVAAGIRADGLGMLVSASRSIARADDPAAAARELRDIVETARRSARRHNAEQRSDAVLKGRGAEVAHALLEMGCVQFGGFTLKSGLHSPIYLDLRRLSGSAAAMKTVAAAYVDLLNPLQFDRVAALPYAGLPLATAACLQGGWPMIYPRKERKAHGRRQAIEGPFAMGDKAVIVDDLATRGTSVLEALPSLTSAGLTATDVVVLVDRASGAGRALSEAGLRLHSVVGLRDLLGHWRVTGAVAAEQIEEVEQFLDGGAH